MNSRALVALVAVSSCATVTDAPRIDEPVVAAPQAVDAGPTLLPTRTQVIHEMMHGVSVADPFRWLEDAKSPEVRGWMSAQNTFARSRLEALPGRAALKERLTALFAKDWVGVPQKAGNRYFYLRQRKDQEKAVLMVREREGAERVLLDPNAFSAENTVSLETWVPSRDGKKLAFSENPNGADESTLFVLDVDTGVRSQVDVLEGAKYASPSWRPDSKSFSYTFTPSDSKISAADRPGYTELRLHTLGEAQVKDVLLHPATHRGDTFLNGGFSRDGVYLYVVKSRGWGEDSVFFKRYGKDKDFTTLVEGKNANYEFDIEKGRFYVLTDEGAPNQSVYVVDAAKPDRANWRLLIPEDPNAARSSLSVVGGRLLVVSLQKALTHVELFTLEGKKVRELELPGLGTAEDFSGHADDDELFFRYSSFIDAPQVLKSNTSSGKTVQWAKTDLPVDPSKYEVKQVTYASKDGTPITMFVVASKDLKLDGSNPTWLTGYGGFNVSKTSEFLAEIYPWLEAGGVFAMANLRGGGEYGKRWHEAGRLANKQNVFDDFAAAAQYLVAQKYTSVKKLGIRGRSNGGLLVGAAMVQHPELVGAVICGVPLLDMVRYPLYGSGTTWVSEYGDPQKAEEFKVLEAYSPYHHVADGVRYPPMLMFSSAADDRVDPFHARKFVARVQQATGGRGTAWLRIEPAAGHAGADQVSKTIDQWVDEIAFLFHALGVPRSIP